MQIELVCLNHLSRIPLIIKVVSMSLVLADSISNSFMCHHMKTSGIISHSDDMTTVSGFVDGVILLVDAASAVMVNTTNTTQRTLAYILPTTIVITEVKFTHTTKLFIFYLDNLGYDNWMLQKLVAQQNGNAIWIIPWLIIPIVQNQLIAVLQNSGAAIIIFSRGMHGDFGSQLVISNCDDHGLLINMAFISKGYTWQKWKSRWLWLLLVMMGSYSIVNMLNTVPLDVTFMLLSPQHMGQTTLSGIRLPHLVGTFSYLA